MHLGFLRILGREPAQVILPLANPLRRGQYDMRAGLLQAVPQVDEEHDDRHLAPRMRLPLQHTWNVVDVAGGEEHDGLVLEQRPHLR